MIKQEYIDKNRIALKEVASLTTFKTIILMVEPRILKAPSYFCVAALGKDEKFYILHIGSRELVGMDLISHTGMLAETYQVNKVLIIDKGNWSNIICEDFNKQHKIECKPIYLNPNVKTAMESLLESTIWFYQSGKIRHVGTFKEAEEQLVAFAENEPRKFIDIIGLTVNYLAEKNIKK